MNYKLYEWVSISVVTVEEGWFMEVGRFVDMIGSDFYAGVPDSQLKALSDYLMDVYGISGQHHIIAANEGNCAALAAGYHLATGKIPVVYMQNSGEGNVMNPVVSLLSDKVYAIPVIFLIGWRGEPGIQDEPQHIYQGEITLKLLEDLDIRTFPVGKDTEESDVRKAMEGFRDAMAWGRQAAFVIQKGGLTYNGKSAYKNSYTMNREKVISHIIKVSGGDPVVSTTGKTSRELFEIRERNEQGHKLDFLTVGSMGHCSSIAMGIAFQKPETTVWCIDGDGAMLMHMGAMAVIGSCRPENMVHVVINNGAHESVGGMPTAAGNVDVVLVARACGYAYAVSAESYQELEHVLSEARKRKGPCFIEVKCALGARDDLGRPTESPVHNKRKFMEYLSSIR